MSAKQEAQAIFSRAEVQQVLKTGQTKSAMIRALDSMNVSRGQIAQILSQHFGKEVRYQHVRNVLETRVTTPKETISTVPIVEMTEDHLYGGLKEETETE